RHTTILLGFICRRNLSPALLPLLEAVVIGAEDDDGRVATASKEVLSRLAQSPQLGTTLRENLYQAAADLPREREQLAALSLVTGYMRLLGSALQDVFTSKVHFEKVVIGLVQVARLDTSGVSVLGGPRDHRRSGWSDRSSRACMHRLFDDWSAIVDVPLFTSQLFCCLSEPASSI
ncbi:unnamed protein product, partial [Timema podura]|nr:unnamed protein product [Timema podura]